ncbi:putative toxin-antitoxin system toxin component, PIN family [Aquimonas voraii]|uniref:Putative toxin-antitoxin system toxin component, PIN family n=1 Tax=Aquimonas voraii TaxID=265719 RepID=A0A1G6WX05_9GAMM|nr:putative toxin-antitoxin system toxin component, PIN family [Aquimonas voraii]SDD70183.1 putative toxin-antitoxin system toxin component, PIN family [Aquimonas voraii]
MATLRVVLDTNVLLSGIAYPASVPGKILAAWRHGSVEVLLSDYILGELRRVLPRLAHRHGLSDSEMDDLVDALSIQAEVIEPTTGSTPDLRDPKDEDVLGTLIAALQTSAADYLITGDKDLLALADRHPIVTPADFWARHAGL